MDLTLLQVNSSYDKHVDIQVCVHLGFWSRLKILLFGNLEIRGTVFRSLNETPITGLVVYPTKRGWARKNCDIVPVVKGVWRL